MKIDAPDVIVRRWRPEDVPSVQRIALTTWRATYGSFIPDEDIQAFFDIYYTAARLTQHCNSDVLAGFLASIGDAPAGFARTSFSREEGKFYISSLYVLPDCQGKSIGTKLMHAAEQHALTFGVDEVWLGVMKQNVRTLEWYKKIGFDFVDEAPFTMGNTTVAHVIGFRKIIRNADGK
jgi:ribosomal protein S18 acetylase RimI-like enzyme